MMSSSTVTERAIPSLVVLTNGNFFARIILEDLFRKHPDYIKGAVIVTGDYHGRSGFRAGWQLLRSMTLPYFFYKVLTLFWFAIAQRLWPARVYTVERLCQALDLPSWTVTSVNSQKTIDHVKLCKPDLILSVSCPQRIKSKVLALAPRGGINVHSSLLPAYAGLAPYFWVLSKGETQTGVTVHTMTRKFDEGEVLAKTTVEIVPGESSFQLFRKLSKAAGSLILDLIENFPETYASVERPTKQRSYFSHPNFAAYMSLRRNGHCLIRLGELWQATKTNTIPLRRNRR